MNRANHQNLRGITTGDPLLDILAVCWADAFGQASRGDEQSRRDLIETFGLNRLRHLYRQRLIKWNPAEVSV